MKNDLNSVVLVDSNDRMLATMDKMEAHELGLLHRAFSVFIFNSDGEMLIHQRALSKYHCGGLWTNACCSHPFQNETPLIAAKRRMQEELGFSCEITKLFDFIYKAKLDNNLTEHEFDHVFLGIYEGPISPNANEVEDYKYVNVNELKIDMLVYPEKYTPWFKIAATKVLELVEERGLAA